MFLIFSKQSVFNRYLRWRNKAQVTDCSNGCNTGWQTTRRSNLNAPEPIPGQLGIVLAVAPGHAPDILICWVGNCTLHTFNMCVIHLCVIHIVLIEISQHFANWWMKSKSLELSMHAFVALNIWLTRYILEANAYLQNSRNYKTSNNLYTLWGIHIQCSNSHPMKSKPMARLSSTAITTLNIWSLESRA